MFCNFFNSAPAVLNILSESGFKFYLTGSRYWGIETSKSDWDFFTQHTIDVVQFLKDNNFVKEKDDYIGDGFCEGVWTWRPSFLGGPIKTIDENRRYQIQVQLVNSVELKQEVQNVLYANFPLGFKSKEDARLHWTMALDLVKIGRRIALPQQQEHSDESEQPEQHEYVKPGPQPSLEALKHSAQKWKKAAHLGLALLSKMVNDKEAATPSQVFKVEEYVDYCQQIDDNIEKHGTWRVKKT